MPVLFVEPYDDRVYHYPELHFSDDPDEDIDGNKLDAGQPYLE